MAEPLLKLEKYHFSDIHVKTNSVTERFTGGLSTKIGVGWAEDRDDMVLVSLEVLTAAYTDRVPLYDLRVKVIGAFRVPPKVDDVLIAKHGALALIGPVRELISTLTARSPHGSLFIPIMSFDSIEQGEASDGSEMNINSPVAD